MWRKPARTVGGSTLKYFLTFEIETFSEDFICKKHSMVLNVITVLRTQAPNKNSKN